MTHCRERKRRQECLRSGEDCRADAVLHPVTAQIWGGVAQVGRDTLRQNYEYHRKDRSCSSSAVRTGSAAGGVGCAPPAIAWELAAAGCRWRQHGRAQQPRRAPVVSIVEELSRKATSPPRSFGIPTPLPRWAPCLAPPQPAARWSV